MNKAFLQFNDRAVSSGILGFSPDFARELKTTTEQFLTLARNASNGAGSDVEDREDDEGIAPARKKAKTNTARGTYEQELDLNTQESGSFADIGWGYAQKLDVSSSDSSRRQSEESQAEFLPGVRMSEASHLMQRLREPHSTQYIPFFGLDDVHSNPTSANDDAMDIIASASANYNNINLNSFNALVPSPPAISGKAQVDSSQTLTMADGPFAIFPSGAQPMTPPPAISPTITTKLGLPYTYSFQEPTFARRLHRAAIERAFHLISQAEMRPQRFAEVFGLTLRFSDRNDIRHRMRQILSRGPSESLEACGGPYNNFGGAGTHYPRRDSNGSIVNKPENWSEKRIGPFGRLPQLQRQAQALGMDMVDQYVGTLRDDEIPEGYEGEWFDADDVEGYLEERGLKLEAQAHFVEGEVADIDEMLLGPDVGRSPSGTTTVAIADASPFARSPNPNLTANSIFGTEKDKESNKRLDDQPWTGIFHDLASFDKMSGFDTSSLFPETMSLDLIPMGRMNDFGSSAWFDDPTFSGASPVTLTAGSTAESNSPAADMAGVTATASAGKRRRTVTVDVARLIDGESRYLIVIAKGM